MGRSRSSVAFPPLAVNIGWWASEPHYADHIRPLAEPLEAVGGTDYASFLAAQETDLVLVASRKDARRFSRVVMVEHGAGQRYGSNAGGADTPEANVELFLAPSQRVADQDASVYPNAVRVAVGSPRVEYLQTLPRVPEKVVISFHWNAGLAQEARSAWPHYQRNLSILRGLPMLGHGHPRMLRRLIPAYQRAGIPTETDWGACVTQASVLVCDNSSIIFEAAALGIPVVVLDAPWYQAEWGMRFFEYADVGPRVSGPTELVAAITEVLEKDRWSARRAEVGRAVYGEVAGSTRRAVEVVRHFAVSGH